MEFIVNDYDSLSVVPIEVKSGKDYDLHPSLDAFVETPDYNISHAIVLSNEREVVRKGKVIYMPVYYSMFLTPSTPEGKVLL